MLAIRRYDPGLQRTWDAFVHQSKNATFLHMRQYMDYHADRFQDASLIIMKDDVPLALLPANREAEELSSHGGLTYGGFLVDHRMGVADALSVFEATCGYLAGQGLRSCIYKPFPI